MGRHRARGDWREHCGRRLAHRRPRRPAIGDGALWRGPRARCTRATKPPIRARGALHEGRPLLAAPPSRRGGYDRVSTLWCARLAARCGPTGRRSRPSGGYTLNTTHAEEEPLCEPHVRSHLCEPRRAQSALHGDWQAARLGAPRLCRRRPPGRRVGGLAARV